MRSIVRLATAALVLLVRRERPTSGITMDVPPRPLRLAAPDTTYRMSKEDRAKVQEGFDADALERLVSMVRPDMRQELLVHFQVGEEGGPLRGRIVQMNDPVLQQVLEEVWAPMWDDVPDEDLDVTNDPLPGRGVAKQRRAAARSAKADKVH
jgi:hypothetical protein